MKRCPKCGVEKIPQEFYQDKRAKSGLSSLCRACDRERGNKYYKNNKLRHALRMHNYYVANKDKILRKNREWELKNPEIRNAQERRLRKSKPEQARARELRYAVRHPEKKVAKTAIMVEKQSGRLKTGPCQICGSTEKIHGHHPDYSKPLYVIWLCRKHHQEVHSGKRELICT